MITTTRVRCGQHGEPLGTDEAGRIVCSVEGRDCTSWSDLQPQPDERVRREPDGSVVVDHEDGVYGEVSFVVERTGGNCTALVHETYEGAHVVLTNGDASHDVSGPVLAAVYSPGDWHDSGDPVWTAEGDDADALARQALASL